jgi:type II secretory pathway pseudopilin PulG
MKGQAQIVGFTLLTLIMLSITAIVFFWANPLIERSNNINEVSRMEANLRMLDNAIHEVAIQQTQRSINFDIDKGFLRVKNNATIEFTSVMDLPSMSGERIVVKGYNKTSGGACLNSSRIGVVGIDSSSCITKQGAIIYQIYFPLLNDTVNNECVGIRLGFGDNTGAGKGKHSILLTYDYSNTTAETSCPTINKPVVKIDIT